MLSYGQKTTSASWARGKPTGKGRVLMPFDGTKFYVPELKIPTAKYLRDKLNKYEQWCVDNKHHVSWESLAVYLGVTTQTLDNYRDKIQVTGDPKELDSICAELSRARSIIQMYYADGLHNKETERGMEFLLKNHFGYSDRQDIGLDSSGLEIRLSPDLDKYSK